MEVNENLLCVDHGSLEEESGSREHLSGLSLEEVGDRDSRSRGKEGCDAGSSCPELCKMCQLVVKGNGCKEQLTMLCKFKARCKVGSVLVRRIDRGWGGRKLLCFGQDAVGCGDFIL
jgi:hypothetical protein